MIIVFNIPSEWMYWKVPVLAIFTLHNVCAVHRGMFSTLGFPYKFSCFPNDLHIYHDISRVVYSWYSPSVLNVPRYTAHPRCTAQKLCRVIFQVWQRTWFWCHSWINRTFPQNDVALQVETPGQSTILSHDMTFIHVMLEVASSNDHETCKCCHRHIFSSFDYRWNIATCCAIYMHSSGILYMTPWTPWNKC